MVTLTQPAVTLTMDEQILLEEVERCNGRTSAANVQGTSLQVLSEKVSKIFDLDKIVGLLNSLMIKHQIVAVLHTERFSPQQVLLNIPPMKPDPLHTFVIAVSQMPIWRMRRRNSA